MARNLQPFCYVLFRECIETFNKTAAVVEPETICEMKFKEDMESDVWNDEFATQLRVRLFGKLNRIREAAHVLRKAGMVMRHLTTGMPSPLYPVQDPMVGEKLLKRCTDIEIQ